VDPISNSDRILALLRVRLREQARSSKVPMRRVSGSPRDGMAAVRALAEVEARDDRQIRRLFLQEILVEQFGPNLIQDAKFQTVVDNVLDALGQDEATRTLMDRVLSDFEIRP
jgi:hypothetical protein